MNFSIPYQILQSSAPNMIYSRATYFSCSKLEESIILATSEVSVKDYLKSLYLEARNRRGSAKVAAENAKKLLVSNDIRSAKEAMIAINIFKLSGDLEEAVNVLNHMINISVVDAILFNNVIDGFARRRQWEMAIELLENMIALSIIPDTISYSSAICACEKAGRWQEALQLLEKMILNNIDRDTICYSSVISACASRGRWKESLMILKQMKVEGIAYDTITLNSAILAAAKDGQVDIVLKLLSAMSKDGYHKDMITYTSAISACLDSDNWQCALRLVDELTTGVDTAELPFTTAPFNAAISVCLKYCLIHPTIYVRRLMISIFS